MVDAGDLKSPELSLCGFDPRLRQRRIIVKNVKKYPKTYPIPAPNNYELILSHQIEVLAEKLNEVVRRLNRFNKCAHTRYGGNIDELDIHDIHEE